VLIVLAGSLDLISPEEILTFGPNPEYKNPIVIMQRLVDISDMTYVAKIAFWKE
jgi:hypothetical protein